LPKGGTAQLSVSATAPDGRPLTYSWQAPANWSLSPNGSTATLTDPNEPGQSATIEVTVEAENGNTASASLLVSTERNTQPIIQNINTTPSAVEPSGTMTVQVLATDPDGDSLTYNWSSPSDWSASQDGDTLTLTAPNQHSVVGTVDVTVSDG
jgi:chitinase